MFDILKTKVRAQFKTMSAQKLFNTDYDRDEIWRVYIDAFDAGSRDEHRCNTCKAFIRQIGGAVTIDPTTLALSTVWDLTDVPEEYAASIAALHKYVSGLKVNGLYYHWSDTVGTDKNLDGKRNVIWHHFQVTLPNSAVDCGGDKVRASAALRSSKDVFKRALDEIKPDAVATVLDLIAQDSLYRGDTLKHTLATFQACQRQYSKIPDTQKDLFCWDQATRVATGIAHIRNTSLGTLLGDLSEGKELEQAVKAYDRITAPANYKRPTALVTPRMVEDAKKTLAGLNLLSALDRRHLDSRDLSAANALYVNRPTTMATDVFATLAQEAPVNTKTLSKVEEIGVDDFLAKVVPGATKIRALFERPHLGNLVTLTGPQDPDAKSMMAWDNSFGWSYSGGVASGIKEKVKAAGGNVTGWMRISMAWHNYDDLDLHFHAPGKSAHVCFHQMSFPPLGVTLDIDMNRNARHSREPVENVHVNSQLPAGVYWAQVHNYRKRETSDGGYEVEIEVNGDVVHYSSAKSPGQDAKGPMIGFKVDKSGTVTFDDCALSRSSTGMTKWGLKTGMWHTVNEITLSPNHWTKPTGLKHWFFLLNGCVADEPARPFYNEFLCPELTANRKVMEVLASKIVVAPAEGRELSGLGFEVSSRNHLYVEVTGTFVRTLKVLF